MKTFEQYMKEDGYSPTREDLFGSLMYIRDMMANYSRDIGEYRDLLGPQLTDKLAQQFVSITQDLNNKINELRDAGQKSY